MDKTLTIFLSPDEVSAVVKRLAEELRAAYGAKDGAASGERARAPVMIAILKGAFVFAADLIRETGMQVALDFMRLGSYGSRDEPKDTVSIIKDIELDIRGRDVLIIEDIVDRGLTLKTIIGHLEQKGPTSIRVCSLLLRATSEQAGLVDFAGKSIDEGFVVGYGMDYKERYRELAGLYIITLDNAPGNDNGKGGGR